MKKIRICMVTICLLVGASVVITAQTAKYNAGGELIWITNLLTDPTGCEPSQSVTGKISKVESFPGDHADGWEFVLAIPRSKPRKFQASLSHDEGAVLADFDELLQAGRRVMVSARQCGSGGYWTVESVRRM